MCPKVKKPVKANSSANASDRKAALQAKLDAFFKEKGMLNDDNRSMGTTRYDHGVRPSELLMNVDKERLRERDVRFEGVEENRDPPVFLFTSKRCNHTTITVDCSEKDVLSALDKELSRKKTELGAIYEDRIRKVWDERGLLDEYGEPIKRTRHSNSLEERKERTA